MDLVMANELQKTRTEMTVTSAQYNVGLTEADLSRRALEQGGPAPNHGNEPRELRGGIP